MIKSAEADDRRLTIAIVEALKQKQFQRRTVDLDRVGAAAIPKPFAVKTLDGGIEFRGADSGGFLAASITQHVPDAVHIRIVQTVAIAILIAVMFAVLFSIAVLILRLVAALRFGLREGWRADRHRCGDDRKRQKRGQCWR
jgi:hypothetical protein